MEKLIYFHMETKHKELYDAPSMLVFEVKIEGVVCQSQDGIESTRKGYGTALEDTWD